MRNKLLATTIVATIGTAVWTGGAWAQSSDNSQRPDKEMSQQGGSATKAPAQQKERMKKPDTGQAGQAQATPEPPAKPKGDENTKSSAGTSAQTEKTMDQNSQPAMRKSEKKQAGQASGTQESHGATKPENATGKTSTGAQAEKKADQNAQPAMRNGEKERGSGKQESGRNAAGTEKQSGANAESGKMAQPETGAAKENGGTQAGTTANSRGEGPAAGASSAGRSEQKVTVSGNVHISQDNASRVAKALMSTAPEQKNVNVNVAVGRPLPGNLELRALPPDVVSLVPEYRGLEYVVVGEEIVIVQPSTRKVVEVIRQGRMAQAPEGRNHRARISLTDSQRRMLLDSVRKEKLPEAQIAELSDGEAVPQDIELEPLPPMVATEIPTIEPYRIVIVPGDRVVLVDPETRAVVDIFD